MAQVEGRREIKNHNPIAASRIGGHQWGGWRARAESCMCMAYNSFPPRRSRTIRQQAAAKRAGVTVGLPCSGWGRRRRRTEMAAAAAAERRKGLMRGRDEARR
jgi:hypothetical protein